MDELNKIFTVYKPWGDFTQYTHNQISTVKILTVSPNQRLSLQSHKKRDELWIPITKGAIVQIDDKIIEPEIGDKLFIPKSAKHRLSSKDVEIKVLEISFGFFDEEDVTRYDDDFGRI
jgi:mannose-1-phosphate guanylyltransferase/mannose-6-phosphate isomerase